MNTKHVFHYFIDDIDNKQEPLTTACGLKSMNFDSKLAGFHIVNSTFTFEYSHITCKRCRKTNKYKTDAFNHLLGVDNV